MRHCVPSVDRQLVFQHHAIPIAVRRHLLRHRPGPARRRVLHGQSRVHVQCIWPSTTMQAHHLCRRPGCINAFDVETVFMCLHDILGTTCTEPGCTGNFEMENVFMYSHVLEEAMAWNGNVRALARIEYFSGRASAFSLYLFDSTSSASRSPAHVKAGRSKSGCHSQAWYCPECPRAISTLRRRRACAAVVGVEAGARRKPEQLG